ncbi:MAG: SelB C-terminal domain-containing protein, partial [Acetobacteraceae bacterium]|nr:SelB C-terminal domain-containing protein [Acetobacteraceae bacterium]
ISIALGFAHFAASPELEVDLIDMPGHERFVRTMIAGATGIDAVLLVVAANEGIKPQTREHLDIAGLLGLRRAVIAVSKADLVEPGQAAEMGEEAAVLAARAGLQADAPVAVCAPAGTGLERLREAVARLGVALAAPASDGVPFLPIDRAFSVAGHGTVVTGTLRGGPLAPGDTLELLPARRPVRVRGLQVHGARVGGAVPGQRVAVNLRDVEAGQVASGAALAPAGVLGPSRWLTVQLRSVADAAELPTASRVQALLGTAEIPARLRLLDRDVLGPGETAPAQLHLAEAVAIPAREHLVLRQASPARTVAGGLILEAETGRQRRHAAAVLQRVALLAGEDMAALVASAIENAGEAGMTLHSLSRLTGRAPVAVAALVQTLPVVTGRKGTVVARAGFERLQARIVILLRRHEDGLRREALLPLLPALGPGLLDDALQALAGKGSVRQSGGIYAVPRPERDAAKAQSEAALEQRMAELLRRGGLTPPDPAPLAADIRMRRSLDRLLREGVLVRTHDRVQKRDILFHREAVAEAQRRLAPLLAKEPGLLVSEIGAALGISRKYSVPLLEHLDAIRFTRRVADRRLLATL